MRETEASGRGAGIIEAVRDPRLRARVVRRTPLLYEGPAAPDEDRRTDRDGSITLEVGKGGLRARSYAETHRPVLYPNLWAKLAACARRDRE